MKPKLAEGGRHELQTQVGSLQGFPAHSHLKLKPQDRAEPPPPRPLSWEPSSYGNS